MTLGNLTCEYAANPLGIDTIPPRLSWQLSSLTRGARQVAYQVLVASSLETLQRERGDLWDSGRVISDQSVFVPYDGEPLGSAARAYWKVRVWSEEGPPTAYSEPAWWEMGLLRTQDWAGEWIGASRAYDRDGPPRPAPLFRKEILLPTGARTARAYVAGLGYYELYLNGRKVGDHVLDPGFTRYDRRVLYVTYDVTEHLSSGSNVLGVVLGNGWYNSHANVCGNFNHAPWRDQPKLLLQLNVILQNGASYSLASDGSWTWAPGPVRYDGIFNGEHYDAAGSGRGGASPTPRRRAGIRSRYSLRPAAAWSPNSFPRSK